MSRDFDEFEQKIGYSFIEKDLLREALTHSSKGDLRHNGARLDNERLEFIGDAMLDAIIGVSLYKNVDTAREGELTKLRSQIVCEESLNRIGNEYGFGDYLIMGEGEERSSGRNKPSVIADSVEAVIGGVYLDGGYEVARDFVERIFKDLILEAIEGKLFRDYKTKLQELAQKKHWAVEYVTRDEGPDHDKTFYISLKINGKEQSQGKGKSKKEAEQQAAENFLRKAQS